MVALTSETIERCPVGSLLVSTGFDQGVAVLISKTLIDDTYHSPYWKVEVIAGEEVFSIEIEEHDIFF